MTAEDWDISTRSKVTDLDFFVIISSVNGIFGGRAQANYAAGNTFKDALAHFRLAHGQKSVSIDLGMMLGEGVVAESDSLLASMRRIGHLMDIELRELLALLEYYCNPHLPLLGDIDAQILVGIEMPSAVLAKGIDLHHSIHRPIFRHLFQMSIQDPGADAYLPGAIKVDRAAGLREAKSEDDAVNLVIEWFSGKVAQILGLSKADIDLNKPVHTYGIDSLVAMDLKNWFMKEVGAEITVFLLLGNMSLQNLCMMATEKSVFRPSLK
ncbi:Ochratoxin highly reducing polyketide synthase ota1 [Lachnellula hyalina]|uniref:Ochratoxin highly reducing polyketide synthase ota1 n=1 Tax=Lachnellula hyalina TaxID=1316788 RepID=A0A8H8U3U6_9HELO|nr:Ochratoxin highly reducing polyketide synthase ota1 [Lachnellula hyalina]TVY30657.1 Ochratoxin highly reducing polyketide synthase ota1 [Lachnellula hyalina]